MKDGIRVRKIKKIYRFPFGELEKEWWQIIKKIGDQEKIAYISIDDSDEMLKKAFYKHEYLYKRIANIPDEILPEFHSNDSYFSFYCDGFVKFVRLFISPEMDDLREIAEKIVDLINKGEKLQVETEIHVLKEFNA